MPDCIFFNKVAALTPVNLIQNKTLAKVFSCEFCEISKNTFSYRTAPVAAPVRCSKKSRKFHRSLFLVTLQFWGPAALLKKTPTQVLSSKIWEIFENNYFEEHLWTTASELIKKETPKQVFSCECCELFKNIYFKEHLQTAGSKTPVRGFRFNKVASLTARRPWTVLERDPHTDIFLWILCNF